MCLYGVRVLVRVYVKQIHTKTYEMVGSHTCEVNEEMKSHACVLLLPVLIPIWLLGFAMVQLGENRDTTTHSRSSKLNLATRIEEPRRPTDEQKILV